MKVADELLDVERCATPDASPVYEELATLVRQRYMDRSAEMQAVILSVAYAKYSIYKKQRAIAEYERCDDDDEFGDVVHTLVRSAASHYDDWIRAGEALLDGVMPKAGSEAMNGPLDRLRPDLDTIGKQLSLVSELSARTLDRLGAQGRTDAGSGSRLLSFVIFDPLRNAATIMLAVAWLWLIAWGLEVMIPRLPDVIARLVGLVTHVSA